MALPRQLLPLLAVLVSAAAQPAIAEAAPESTPGAGIKVSFRPSRGHRGPHLHHDLLPHLPPPHVRQVLCHSSSTPLPAAIPTDPAAAPPQAASPGRCLARFDDADHFRLLPRYHVGSDAMWM